MSDFDRIAQAVFDLDGDKVVELVEQFAKEGVAPEDIINKGLIAGIEKVGILFKNGDLFIPEVMAATNAMKGGLAIIEPLLKRGEVKNRGLVVLGTVRGDIHDIGRRLVATMLEAGGFQVADLGNDVAEETFVQKIHELKPQIIAMSALLNTTILYMKTTIEAIKEGGLRDKVKIMVGGSPVTPALAQQIGADGTAPDAVRAVDLAKSLLGS
jgi:5-methyltetrahydrofolate--homocysteine methyltransferase